MNQLSESSLNKLQGVHPDLVKVVVRAIQISPVDFTVTCGVRTAAEQKKLVAKGASTTMNSRHIPGKDGLSKAVDLAALQGGAITWDWAYYHKIAAAMKQAAKELGVSIEWGGDWKTFKDGPHFQLPHAKYP
jgi:peptidoglycan L-alanyl-D-glutamate endopeptidase CwlK